MELSPTGTVEWAGEGVRALHEIACGWGGRHRKDLSDVLAVVIHTALDLNRFLHKIVSTRIGDGCWCSSRGGKDGLGV